MGNSCSCRGAGLFALGAAIGALAGGVAALLLAPQSGEETRKQIKSKTQEAQMRANLAMKEGKGLAQKAGKEAREIKDKVRHATYEAKDRVEELRDNVGKDA